MSFDISVEPFISSCMRVVIPPMSFDVSVEPFISSCMCVTHAAGCACDLLTEGMLLLAFERYVEASHKSPPALGDGSRRGQLVHAKSAVDQSACIDKLLFV